MLFNRTTMDNYVIVDVLDTLTPGQHLSNGVLIKLWGRADSEHQAFITVQPLVSYECGNNSRLLLQLNLVKSQFEIQFAKHLAPIQLVEYVINREYGMTFPYNSFISFPHVYAFLMSPEGLGTTTTGLTHGVGPSAGSILSQSTSSSSF